MRKSWIGAALAAAALFAVLAPPAAHTAPADAPFAIEQDVMQEYVAPRVIGVDEANLTQAPFQPDGEVGLPYGDLLGDLLSALGLVVGAVAAWALRKLPATAVSALDAISRITFQKNANELLEKALTYGINTTAGAVRGKVLTVKIGNEVLERAFEYAIRHAPGLVNKIGGIVGLREKIIARLDLDADAAIPTPRPPADSLISAAPTPSQPAT